MSSSDQKKVIVGVCTMERKARSKPMSNILHKMREYYEEWLDIVIFSEHTILTEPVENWPHCDCLIGFHATDFPLQKAIQYAELRQPYVINDLQRQFDLLDRVKVYQTLRKAGIEHPRHAVLIRDNITVEDELLLEQGDQIEINKVVFHKPFVEKPVSAEDHNINVYYPSSVGGGSQRLFRKINNRSSIYSPTSNVRSEGSYIYEEFIPADGTDVKVYAVGPYYAHAEARKSPALDGKVDRDSTGKEIRYPVILTNKEKLIARKVVVAFGQTVCGFDLLRAGGKSYVCDVNGFSFVKTSTKYYEDTAKILGNMILRRLAYRLNIPWKQPYQADDPPLVSTTSGKVMELRCVLAVVRHGDRTPKQKMKMEVFDKRFFELFEKYGGFKKLEIKMKRPCQLKEVLELAHQILSDHQIKRIELIEELHAMKDYLYLEQDVHEESKTPVQVEKEVRKCNDTIKQWDQVRTVLEMYGHFSGINRKVQIKYQKHGRPRQSSGSETESPKQPSLLLILKWGGELTTAGIMQAEALGKLFRTLYPGIGSGQRDEDKRGLGFLRLHSTYRHDLKIYASDEGRVQMTAAAFAKGMLALEGSLPPILVQMVKSANTDGLLDDDCNARQFQNEIKKFLHMSLQIDKDLSTEDFERLNPLGRKSIRDSLEFIKNPRRMCEEIWGYIQGLCVVIEDLKTEKPDKNLYLNESWELGQRRWLKLMKDFRHVRKTGDTLFDISKIPDIYDNIKYDMEHNPELFLYHEVEFERLYLCAKNMADVLVPQEYGIRKDGKLSIAQGVCTPLMMKIRSDLQRCIEGTEDDENLTRLDPRASQGIATPMRHVRTRLYFTSESHIHSLMNLIQYGGLVTDQNDRKWQRAMNFLSGLTEFNYMTQLVLMLYEDTSNNSQRNNSHPTASNKQFHVELLFSPGLYPCFLTEKEKIYEGMFFQKIFEGVQDSSRPAPPTITASGSGDKLDIKAGLIRNHRLASVSETDSGDEEGTTVNLVSLGEVGSSQPFTSEDLAKHSPPSSPPTSPPPIVIAEPEEQRRKNSVGSRLDVISSGVLMKSHSDRRCNVSIGVAEEKKASDNEPRKGSVPEEKRSSRRNQMPYRFKHHTVNLLKDNKVDDKLISTVVITGGNSGVSQKEVPHAPTPVVLSTAVIGRSSSAPRLQTYTSDEEISVSEIRRFWPPMRSLETLHDNILFRQMDDFLKRITTVRTPVPSPPKTPKGENAISRENSDLNPESDQSIKAQQRLLTLDRTLVDTAKRLSALEKP